MSEKTLSVLCYIPYLNLLTAPLALIKYPASELCRFHAKQGFLLLILEFIALPVIALLPVVGSLFGGILSTLIGLAFLVLSVWGAVKAGEGTTYPLPIVGVLSQKIPLEKLFEKKPTVQTPPVPPSATKEQTQPSTPPPSQTLPPQSPPPPSPPESPQTPPSAPNA